MGIRKIGVGTSSTTYSTPKTLYTRYREYESDDPDTDEGTDYLLPDDPNSVYGSEALKGSNTSSVSYVLYEVRTGDTLFSIAYDKYGDCRFWLDIWRYNSIRHPSTLVVGEKLKLPETGLI